MNRPNRPHVLTKSLAFLFAVCAGVATSHAAPITAGDLLVYRAGDGTTALGSAATAAFVDEYSVSGTLVQSISLPLLCSGTSTSEGLITLSTDGQYLMFPGYNTTAGTTGITTSTSIARGVGRINIATGVADFMSFAPTDYATGGNPRSVASTNGTDIWMTGSTVGVRYGTYSAGTSGATSTQLSTTTANLRDVTIAGGNLYVTSSSGSIREAQVGIGLPTAAGNTITNLPGTLSTGSPYQMVFADLSPSIAGVDTMYYADDSATALLSKYTFDGTNWNADGSVSVAGGAFRGLTLSVQGSNVELYLTSNGTTLRTFEDTTGYDGTISGSATTLLATAPTNEAFRGVAIVPAAVPEPGTIATLIGGFAILGLRRNRRHA